MAFEMEVTDTLVWSLRRNRLTVAVNNTLSLDTVPQGMFMWQEESDMYPSGYSTMETFFDFFNYAGIHRSVLLYTTPKEAHISDISFNSDVSEDLKMATISFNVSFEGPVEFCLVCLKGRGPDLCLEGGLCQGTLEVQEPNLWWPYLMSESPGVMHSLEVSIGWGVNEGGMENVKWDTYTQPVGLRQVTFSSTSLMINHKPFYFHGVARHEDSNVRGKGFDLPLAVRDQNLMEWLGANSFRTSHYPYSEEILDLADERGIVVIAECAAVSLNYFGQDLLENHLQAMAELVARDKNHPSVVRSLENICLLPSSSRKVMWSIANEPVSSLSSADSYFAEVLL